VTVNLGDFGALWGGRGRAAPAKVRVEEFRFDKDHNSYFRLGRALRDQTAASAGDALHEKRLEAAVRRIGRDETAEQLAGLAELAALEPAAADAAGAVFELHQRTKDAAVRRKAMSLVLQMTVPQAYPAAAVRKIEELSALRATGTSVHALPPDGRFALKVNVAGNGANWVHIRPATTP
jgi:hypothetical protein